MIKKLLELVFPGEPFTSDNDPKWLEIGFQRGDCSIMYLHRNWRGVEENIKVALQINHRYLNDISPRAARIFINLARFYRDQNAIKIALLLKKITGDLSATFTQYSRRWILYRLWLEGNEEEGKIMEGKGR
ncbi:hypothetical protein PsorP6_006967 [Peronosclerospora sorghi]|uniref:Uncharacterized protein n=1 Tax=Peronosclerospora sorghi TaxID=230839 RepID=A0ACC0WCP6_9STRA|nr:hypothetical protein PsorP6_006967 [Peronosclerospora sorghi]